MAENQRRLGRTGVLGAFEELVLLAVLRQADEAYAVSVRRELADRLDTDVAMGAIYATLDRLEEKQLVRSRAGAVASGPGRPRTYYDVLPDGLAALEQTRTRRNSMWDGVTLPASAGQKTIS